MKCAAWSLLPRAMVSSEVGALARSSAPKSLYAGSSCDSCRDTAAAASRASSSMRVERWPAPEPTRGPSGRPTLLSGDGSALLVVKRDSFDIHVRQFEIA